MTVCYLVDDVDAALPFYRALALSIDAQRFRTLPSRSFEPPRWMPGIDPIRASDC
jgi:hypothetical protein